VPTNKVADHLHSLDNPIIRLDHDQQNLSFMSETAKDNKTKREEIVFNKNAKIHPLIEKLKKQSMSHNKNLKNDDESRSASPAK